MHTTTRTHAHTFTRSTRSLHRPACCLQCVVESADARMDRRAAQEQHSAEGQPQTVEAGHNAARIAATLAAASMPSDTPDGHQEAYSAFCERPVPPLSALLQLLPPGPAVQTHMTVAPLDRSGWLHQFRDGLQLQLPGGGLSLAPVPGPWQRAAPARKPCPGVSQDAADNKILASDTITPSTFHAMTTEGPGIDASSRPNTSGRKYSTDAQGWVDTIWSRRWCAPLDHSTAAPLPVPCSPCRQLFVHAVSGRCKGESGGVLSAKSRQRCIAVASCIPARPSAPSSPRALRSTKCCQRLPSPSLGLRVWARRDTV